MKESPFMISTQTENRVVVPCTPKNFRGINLLMLKDQKVHHTYHKWTNLAFKERGLHNANHYNKPTMVHYFQVPV